jgi:hypothetical protein
MRRTLLIAALVAGCTERQVAIAPAARPPPVFRASCFTPVLGVCTEYTDQALALGEELLRASCHGAWSPARCPTPHQLGHCALSTTHRFYYPGGDLDFSAATAAKDCTELYQGSWADN